ncbi:MAG: MATE family efflux transporter [Candidatus Poribacteria bacterium]|nr:MATE family efflux transporter [Candidatus Poribacteria bacterium]
MNKTQGDLTQGNLLRHLLQLAVPITFGYILQDAFNIVDMIFVGRLGPAAIAAVGVSGNLLRLIAVFSLGISTGAGIMVAQYLGARNHAQAGYVAMQAILLAFFFAIGIGIVGYPLAEFGLRAVRTIDSDVIQFGITYMQIILVGISTMFLSMTLSSIFRAGGDAVTPMVVLILSTLINIVLDPLLIFGLWKFPKLGVAGSAYATLIGRGVGVIILLFLCFSGRAPISLRNVQFRADLVEMLDILRLGVYSSMQGFWRHLSRLGFLWVLGPYGKNVVAAYTVCMRLRIFVMNPGFGIANAVAPVVGQNLGANQIERAEKSTRMGNILGTTVMAGIGALFLIFPQIFIQIFSNDAEVIKIGSVYLQFLSLTFGFIAFSLVLGKALNGAGDTFSPMIITLAAQMGVGLGLVILLSHFIGLKGVWIGIALSNVVQGAAMWLWYRTGRWKTIKIIKNGSKSPTRKVV